MAGFRDYISIRPLLLGQAVDEDIAEGSEDQAEGCQQHRQKPSGKIDGEHTLRIPK